MAGLDGTDTSTTIYIDDLNPLNPDKDDPKSQGDDHIRFTKRVLVNSFPGVTGPVTATHTELNILDGATLTTAELNYVDGVTSAIQTQLNAKAPTASPTFTGTVTLSDPEVGGNDAYLLKGITTYTTGSGTYTVPTGVRALYVECYGGGGGSGGVDGQGVGTAATSGGGGGGGYCAKLLTGTLEASYSYVVGAGGNGGAAGNYNGTAGGASTFSGGSVSMSAGGGGAGYGALGAASVQGTGGGGGSASGGDINLTGGPAPFGRIDDGDWMTLGMSGPAAGPLGGQARHHAYATTGVTGHSPGGGGGPIYIDGVTANYAGGPGGAGLIRITEYY